MTEENNNHDEKNSQPEELNTPLENSSNHNDEPEEAKKAVEHCLAAINNAIQPNTDSAAHWLKTARKKGASGSFLCRSILADSYQHLARSALLLRKFQTSQRLLEESNHLRPLKASSENNFEQELTHLVQLGLLRDAPELLNSKISEIKNLGKGSELFEAKVKILETQISLIRHELQIAQTRGQLQSNTTDASGVKSYGADEERATSQLGQDLWVLQQTNHKKNGFFVEFGATDGVLLSNTYLLETQYEWSGICAEPNPNFFSELKNNRKCIVTNDCISDKTGDEVEFVFADVFGGMKADMASDAHHEKRLAYLTTGQTAKVTTISLNDLLLKYNAPRTIDYLSIDTEGSELRILQAFPFDRWNVRLITVEHNHSADRNKIQALLEKQGYIRKEREWEDWYKLEIPKMKE